MCIKAARALGPVGLGKDTGKNILSYLSRSTTITVRQIRLVIQGND